MCIFIMCDKGCWFGRGVYYRIVCVCFVSTCVYDSTRTRTRIESPPGWYWSLSLSISLFSLSPPFATARISEVQGWQHPPHPFDGDEIKDVRSIPLISYPSGRLGGYCHPWTTEKCGVANVGGVEKKERERDQYHPGDSLRVSCTHTWRRETGNMIDPDRQAGKPGAGQNMYSCDCCLYILTKVFQ